MEGCDLDLVPGSQHCLTPQPDVMLSLSYNMATATHWKSDYA